MIWFFAMVLLFFFVLCCGAVVEFFVTRNKERRQRKERTENKELYVYYDGSNYPETSAYDKRQSNKGKGWVGPAKGGKK